MGSNNISKIGIVFPFDFINMYGGASQRLKADIKALTFIGCSVEVIFPTIISKYLLIQSGQVSNTTLRTYRNLEGFSFLPAKMRLLLDEYGQVLNPFFNYSLQKNFRNLDIIFVHFPSSFIATNFLGRGKTPIIYVAHNFEYGLMRQSTQNPIAHKIIYFFEKYACTKASAVLCVSEKDKLSMQKAYNLPSEKIAVLPNTVDTEFYSLPANLYDKSKERQKLGIDPHSFVLLFSGKMDYRANFEALKFILEELVPILEQSSQDFEVLVVGAQIPQWCLNFKRPKISFHSNVPDMRRFYAVADAAIVPLNSGGGTRLKILESFAAKLPVISTGIGCEGIDCQDGEHILLAQRSAKDFVDKATVLINNTNLREKIIINSYELVTNKYSVYAASKFLKDLLKRISADKKL